MKLSACLQVAADDREGAPDSLGAHGQQHPQSLGPSLCLCHAAANDLLRTRLDFNTMPDLKARSGSKQVNRKRSRSRERQDWGSG
jgi:hypothetical protein